MKINKSDHQAILDRKLILTADKFANYLEEKYPALFENVVCGFDCPPGWQSIVLSISDHVFAFSEHFKTKIKVAQVKEKFGTLRFYIDIDEDEVDGNGAPDWAREILFEYINSVQSTSGHQCQECGKYGEVRGGHWLVTLCDEHESIRQEGHSPTDVMNIRV